MPRGKYVNHKGRSRHFTSPEELAQERDGSSEEQDSSEENEEGAAAGTSKVRNNPKPRAKKVSGGTGSSDEDSDEESSEDDDDKNERKGVASLIEIENPNRATKKATQKLATLKLDGDGAAATSKPELTRREREQIEKQKARARYERLHAAGKTTEAKADLARLALVRQQRAEAAAKREAEKKTMDEKKSTGSKA